MYKLLTPLVAGALALGCGSRNDGTLAPSSNDDTERGACHFTDVNVRPRDGFGPVHRSMPVAVRWEGDAGALTVSVLSKGRPQPGELIRGDRMAVWVPELLYPANALVEWTVRACGVELQGSFATGALTHPLDDVLGTLGTEPWAIDLRNARFVAPSPRAQLGANALLRWQVAPAFLVQLAALDEGTLAVDIAPGVIGDDGQVRQDLRRPTQLLKVSIANNPYLHLRPADFSLARGSGELSLSDVDLVLGLSEEGLRDGRLAAEAQVHGRYLDGDPHDPCALLARLSADTCHPCRDRAGRCFTLALEGLDAVPSEARLIIDVPLGPAELPPRPTLDEPVEPPFGLPGDR